MKIMCISGKAQHGKDTTAEIMKEQLECDGYTALIVHYADLLKYICRMFFDWDGQKDDKGRDLLQYVGTDIIRKKKPNFFVDFIVDMLTMFSDSWDFVLISDCRFPDEIARLIEAKLDETHIRVVRPNFASPLSVEQQRHSSETALDDVVPDHFMNNCGTIRDLQDAVADFITQFNGHHYISFEDLQA